MSEEVALATADLATIAALQSQLGQAHEALLLAQADVETLVTTLRAFFRAPSYDEAGRLRVELHQLARARPGTPLADEVRAARAELAAAQAVIAAAKKCRACLLSSPDMHSRMVALSSALKAYQDATKAGAE